MCNFISYLNDLINITLLRSKTVFAFDIKNLLFEYKYLFNICLKLVAWYYEYCFKLHSLTI